MSGAGWPAVQGPVDDLVNRGGQDRRLPTVARSDFEQAGQTLCGEALPPEQNRGARRLQAFSDRVIGQTVGSEQDDARSEHDTLRRVVSRPDPRLQALALLRQDR